MQDRPTSTELLEAVRLFLETDAIPALEGTKKFHARVAANVLAIVMRERWLEGTHLTSEWRRLDALLGAEAMPSTHEALKAAITLRSERLCARIRNGEADTGWFREVVLDHVRQTVMEKLAIDNPKMITSGPAL